MGTYYEPETTGRKDRDRGISPQMQGEKLSVHSVPQPAPACSLETWQSSIEYYPLTFLLLCCSSRIYTEEPLLAHSHQSVKQGI
jgi:hypothetical protein